MQSPVDSLEVHERNPPISRTAEFSVGLGLPPDVIPHQEAVKQLDQLGRFRGSLKDVDRRESLPSFRRCQAAKVLMGAHVIEEEPDFVQSVLQSGWAVNVDLPDKRFDATEEAFDAAVAPRCANWDALVSNADQLQEGFERCAAEYGFVVGSNGARFAILTDGQAQVADQRPAALVGHCRQLCADSRTMIDDAKNRAWCAMVVLHKR